MNKAKVKNIILGVSIALNLLGGLLVGGALIHSCNAPASPENGLSSVSSASAGKLHAPTKRNALEDQSVDTSEYVNIWDVNQEMEIDGRVLYIQENVLWSSATNSNPDAKVYTMELSKAGLYYMEIEHPSDTWGAIACLSADGYLDLLATPSGGRVNLTTKAYWYNGDRGFFHVSEENLFAGTNDGKVYLVASQNRVSGSRPMPKVYLIDGFDMVSDNFKVPTDFWGYRLLKGSPDANTGGIITPNAHTGNNASGGVRLSNLCFALGDNRQVYEAIEFYYVSFYQRTFIDQSGNLVNATFDSFKSVWYLDSIRVLPIGKDASVYNNWTAIGVSSYGVDGEGNLYINGHNFNWLDESYKTFHLWDVNESASPNVSVTGVTFTSDWLNPTLSSMSINSALRLAMLGTSASGGNGQVIGGGVYTDVFSLIGSAFSSLAPILSVQILPFLTLGTLLLVPLVVLIIFAILKVLNK